MSYLEFCSFASSIKSVKGHQRSAVDLCRVGGEHLYQISVRILNGETNNVSFYAITNFEVFIGDMGGEVDHLDDISDLGGSMMYLDKQATRTIHNKDIFIEEIQRLMDSSPAAVKIFEAPQMEGDFYSYSPLANFPVKWNDIATHPANALSPDLEELVVSGIMKSWAEA